MAKTKQELIDEALKRVSEKYPSSVISRYGEVPKYNPDDFISTGSLAVDYVLGGGLAKKKMSCLAGFPSSGKTTVALMAIAAGQKKDPDFTCVYCDAEWALDVSYAASLGVDVTKLIIEHPDSAEEGYEIIEYWIQTGLVDLVVVDSVTAMRPKELIESGYNDSVQIGRMANLTTKAVGRINNLCGKFGTHCCWIQQLFKATKIGMFDISSPAQLNTNFTMAGGQQFPYYMSQVLYINRNGQLKNGDEIVANIINVKNTKNKVATPYRNCETNILFGKGIDKGGETTLLGISQGIIKKSGTKYLFPTEALQKAGLPEDTYVVGRQKCIDFLSDEKNSALLDEINKIVKDKIFSNQDNGKDNIIKIEKDEENIEDTNDNVGEEVEDNE